MTLNIIKPYWSSTKHHPQNLGLSIYYDTLHPSVSQCFSSFPKLEWLRYPNLHGYIPHVETRHDCQVNIRLYTKQFFDTYMDECRSQEPEARDPWSAGHPLGGFPFPIWIWVNYNDLTITGPWNHWFSMEIIPWTWPSFRLVNYYHLPRWMISGECPHKTDSLI